MGSFVSDFSNELNIRIYVSEILKDYIKDDKFEEYANKMLSFIIKDIDIAKKPNEPFDYSKAANMIMTSIVSKNTNVFENSKVKDTYLKFKNKRVAKLSDPGCFGNIVGYNESVNELICLCDNGSIKGFKSLNESDIIPEISTLNLSDDNYYFYITIDDVEKQIL